MQEVKFFAIIVTVNKEQPMTKNSTELNNLAYDEAFEIIQILKKRYLTAVNNLLVGADLKTIVMLNDVKKILTAENASRLANILLSDVNSATVSKLGIKRAYKTSISVAKLQDFLDSIDKAYKKQVVNLDKEMMKREIKKLEQLVLEQLAEKDELNRNINNILDLTSSFTRDASEKTRLTAMRTKNGLKRATETIKTILQRRYQNKEKPETVDTQKLQRVYWGKPEEYYK